MVAKTLLILSVLLASTAFSMPTASALLSEIGLSYSNGKVAQKSMQLTKGFMPQAGRMGSGSYGITVISYTGKTLWESKVGGRILFEPAVVGGRVYVATDGDGSIYSRLTRPTVVDRARHLSEN